MRWYRAASFGSLQAAGLALHRLEAFCFGRPDRIGYQAVVPGPEDEPILIVTALARDDFFVTSGTRRRIDDTFESCGGTATPLPDAIVNRLYWTWDLGASPEVWPNPMLMSTLDIAGKPHAPREDLLVVTSHAKCQDCGTNRHKIARLNICQECWQKIKPAIRRQWRGIKERRQLRRAVEEHIAEQRRQRELQANLATLRQQRNAARKGAALVDVDLTPQEQAKVEIARMRAEGVPPPGTPERARYMTLHAIANSGAERRNSPGEVNAQDRLLGRLYAETDVMVRDLFQATGLDSNRLRRVQRILQIPNRDDVRPFNPPVRVQPGDELVVINGEALFKSETGLMRPVFGTNGVHKEDDDEAMRMRRTLHERPEPGPDPEPDPAPDPAPDPQPEPEPEPVLAIAADRPLTEEEQRTAQEAFAQAIAEPEPEPAPEQPGNKRGRRRAWSPEVRAEIVAAYQDPSVSVSEIQRAYGVAEGTLYRFLKLAGVPVRSAAKSEAGRQGYERYQAAQLHLGQAPGAAIEEETPTVTTPTPPTSAPAPTPQPDASPVLALIRNQAYEPQQRAWAVTYIVQRTELVAAPSIDEALRIMRERHGDDIDVVQLQRS